MHESHLVCGAERARHVDEPAHAIEHGDLSVAHGRAQRLPFHELHHDEQHTVLLADVVDVDDVRVLERGGHARLAQHTVGGPGAHVGVAGAAGVGAAPVGAQHLDGYAAAERGVVGAEDLAHAALAEQAFDGVATDPVTRAHE